MGPVLSAVKWILCWCLHSQQHALVKALLWAAQNPVKGMKQELGVNCSEWGLCYSGRDKSKVDRHQCDSRRRGQQLWLSPPDANTISKLIHIHWEKGQRQLCAIPGIYTLHLILEKVHCCGQSQTMWRESIVNYSWRVFIQRPDVWGDTHCCPFKVNIKSIMINRRQYRSELLTCWN